MNLIGLELMSTIAMYIDEHVIHVEVTLSVAMIAIASHDVDIYFTKVPPLAMIGIGARNHCRIDDWVLLCQKRPVYSAHNATVVHRQLNKETKR